MDKDIYTTTRVPVNVDERQRTLSIIAGSLLLISSVRKKFSLVRALAGGYLLYRGLAGYCAVFAAFGKKKLPDPANNILIRTMVRVRRPRHEVYAFWRELKNLPLFMRHLSSVEEITHTRSRWKMHLLGKVGTVRWETQVTRDIPGSLIEWDSVPGSPLMNAGKVVFEDADDNETNIHALIAYTAPRGAAGDFVAKLIMNPILRTIVRDDIINVKVYLERGLIAKI